MNVFIVDDEFPAREELAWLLDQCEGVTVVGQAGDAKAGMAFIAENAVDVVFLDINMPGLNGMRFAETLYDRFGDAGPSIIFATAHADHAVDAFEVAAVDYILKPIRLERLQRALEKVRAQQPAAKTAKRLERISIEEQGEYRVIDIVDVLYFEAEYGVVVAHTKQERFNTEFNLKFLEDNLDPEHFFRAHRSFIVQLNAVKSIAPWGAGTYQLVIDREADLIVPLARSRATEFKSRIPWSASMMDND